MRVAITDQMIDELVESMRAVGQLVPLIVTLSFNNADERDSYAGADGAHNWCATRGLFEVIDGHCRLVAAERVPLEALDCSVFLDVAEAKHAMMLHAGIIRNSFTPYEEGRQFVELSNKHGWSIDDICRTFNRSEHYINTRVDIATGPENVARAVQERTINLAQATQILKAKDEGFQVYLLDQAEVHGATARTLEVMRHNHGKDLAVDATGARPGTPAGSVPPPPPVVHECVWCGEAKDVENLRQLEVHWYHEREVRQVLDSVSVLKLNKASA